MFTHHHHHHHLPSIILTTIFIFISIYIPTSHSLNCTNFFHCGELRIGYPFYGQDRPSACGLQGFELKCEDNDITTIEISYQTFQVLKIDQNVHSITLARSDLLDDVCPQRFNDTTTNDILFSYDPRTVQFLNLYYSCPFRTDQIPDSNRVSCSTNIGGEIIGYYLNESLWTNDQLRSCDVNVTVPVLRMAVGDLLSEGGNISLTRLLEYGFPLEYKFNVEACVECENSGGLCWSGTNTSTPTCDCEDEQIHAGACPNSGVHILTVTPRA